MNELFIRKMVFDKDKFEIGKQIEIKDPWNFLGCYIIQNISYDTITLLNTENNNIEIFNINDFLPTYGKETLIISFV